MLMETRTENGVTVIQLVEKRLDASLAGSFKDKLKGLIARGSNKLVINLSFVAFIDSSGLGSIVSVLKALGKDGRMALCNVDNPLVMDVFRLTRMTKVFPFFADEQEAVAHLAG